MKKFDDIFINIVYECDRQAYGRTDIQNSHNMYKVGQKFTFPKYITVKS